MNPILPNSTIGIIGGGQLGKMLAVAANTMGYRVVVLDANIDAPAFSAAHESIVGALDDFASIESLVKQCDVVTYEFENIDARIINELAKQYKNIPQGDRPLYIAQNRIREKATLTKANIPVAPYVVLNDVAKEITLAIETLGFPFIVKTAEGGYDGKGQVIVRERADLAKVAPFYGITCVAEKFIPYDFECSIIATRSTQGEYKTFPIAHNIHINNILHQSLASNSIVSTQMASKMESMLKSFMEQNDLYGTLALEAFVVGDDIYANELAPRPHNSGHYTIEGCETSQFEQHIRAICGLPLGSTKLRQETVMYNILGQHKSALFDYLAHCSPRAHLHLYGKKDYVHNRKMGHITFTDLEEGKQFEHAIF